MKKSIKLFTILSIVTIFTSLSAGKLTINNFTQSFKAHVKADTFCGSQEETVQPLKSTDPLNPGISCYVTYMGKLRSAPIKSFNVTITNLSTGDKKNGYIDIPTVYEQYGNLTVNITYQEVLLKSGDVEITRTLLK